MVFEVLATTNLHLVSVTAVDVQITLFMLLITEFSS
jgi:hypothetical protein